MTTMKPVRVTTTNNRRRQRGLGKLTPVEFELPFTRDPDEDVHSMISHNRRQPDLQQTQGSSRRTVFTVSMDSQDVLYNPHDETALKHCPWSCDCPRFMSNQLRYEQSNECQN
jgi:hypothetical protein